MRRSAATLVILGCTLITIACAKGGEPAADTATSMAPMGDSAMAGMDHSKMPGMATGPAKDADHAFLRMMSDHHEGLVSMASAAMNSGSAEQTKADAHQLHTKQGAERDSMVAMIRSMYGETYAPAVMAKNKAQNDSLQALSGMEYDRKFYSLVVQHHREGIAMMDSVMANLTKDPVKAMARRMKTDQQREVQEFQRKMGS